MKRDIFTDPVHFGQPLHMQIATLSAWWDAVISNQQDFTPDSARAFGRALDHAIGEARAMEIEIARLREGNLAAAFCGRAGKGGGPVTLGGAKVVSLDAFRPHPLQPDGGSAA